ncbi:zinc finger protein [Daphnia sinensis]|uniref:Zinc finger protein n=1 Tax=Daphnia sinensis TaxID=1820382 RepID=A0AAD5PNY5_9CRUS|nr:zinc finger protein [Daphnia sinensis]
MGAVASRSASGATTQHGERAESQQYRSDNRSILKWTADGKPICSRCKTEGHIGRECPTKSNGQGGLRGRTPDGKIVCYGCGGIGHISRNCPSSQREGAPEQQQQQQVRFAGEGKQVIGLVGTEHVDPGVLAWPILKIDIQRMVVLDVWCWGKQGQ